MNWWLIAAGGALILAPVVTSIVGVVRGQLGKRAAFELAIALAIALVVVAGSALITWGWAG